MVAVIKTGHSIHRIVNYNENKVKEGVAECIAAVNYPKDVADLSLTNKLNRLLKQAALNENVSRNSVHISLNFDRSETLSKERLQEIAETYMEKVGFGGQPCLVYQHHDAGHPHIHIVTIKVREDGSRIDTQNIGRNQSEKARKEIEQSFGLTRAEGSKQNQVNELKRVNISKVQYGRSETKKAISNVLNSVLHNYKYTSLPELNAVLRQYNVIADRGSENSRIFKNNGLMYRILDEQGNRVGVSIKASDFYNKPTLSFLEGRFQHNESHRQPYKARVKNAIDLSLLKQPGLNLQELIKALEKEGINTVLRKNGNGLIYGITYVDHRTKCVFNGSSLGKQYSANAIQERCKLINPETLRAAIQTSDKGKVSDSISYNHQHNSEHPSTNPEITDLLENLLQPEHALSFIPHQLKKKGKKKKRKI